MLLDELARDIATTYHAGQTRKKRSLPYIVHPANVVRNLQKFGIRDEKTLATAWLHDTLEDTTLTYDKIEKTFGSDIATGVYLLTRNIDDDQYTKRLSTAPKHIQMVKLCDLLDNMRTLEALDQRGQEKKLRECMEFYLPLAEKICPEIGHAISLLRDAYFKKTRDFAHLVFA